MTDKQDLKQDTERLKQLIAQVNNTGEAAWEAGKLLKETKDKKEYVTGYGTFENYTTKEFNITPQTANGYILVHEVFTKEEIGSVMLISHLQVIAEIKDLKVRSYVLEKLRNLREQGKEANNYEITTHDIVVISSLISGIADIQKIGLIINFVIKKAKEKITRASGLKKQQDKFDNNDLFGSHDVGVPFSPKFFQEISLSFSTQPINEMGVVGLFCVALPTLRNIEFDWRGEKVSFHSVKMLRSAFPDSEIIISKKIRKGKKYDLATESKYIEFEFQSYSYIDHQHHKSPKKCDLIVCWEDTLKTEKDIANIPEIKKTPPVFSLKHWFETGTIKLFE